MKRIALLLALILFSPPSVAGAADKPVKVFLLGGQSNMDGCGRWRELPEALREPPVNVVMWDNALRKWVPLGTDSFARRRGNMFGPEIAFARKLARAYPDQTIALVKTSAGGTKLHTQWLPGKAMYGRFRANNKNAISRLRMTGKKFDIAGMLWMQGESDSETVEMARAYEKNLKELVRDVREKTGHQKLPFVMGRISTSLLKKTPWNFDHAAIVRRGQQAVADADPDVYIIDTDKLSTLKDNTHFDTKAQLTLGDEMATLMLRAIGHERKKNKTETPKNHHEIRLKVNWRQMLADHDMIWKKLPTDKTQAPHLGNGEIGSMLWFEKGAMRLQVYRADVHDHNDHTYGWSAYSRPRLGIGHFLLTTRGKITGCDLRLDIYEAELVGTVTTDKGAFSIRHLVHYHDSAIYTEITATGGEGDFQWKWRPEPATTGRGGSPGNRGYGARYAPYKKVTNPKPVISSKKDLHLCIQNLSAGGQYAAAWKSLLEGKGRCKHIVTVANSYPNSTAADACAAGIRRVEPKIRDNSEAWIESHRQWWRDYYPASFVTFPETVGRTFYWNNVYRLACCTRPDAKYIDTPGMWSARGPWPYSTHDFNTQVAHWPVYASNRLEMGVALVETFGANRANLIDNVVPAKWRGDSAFLPLATAYDLRGKRDGDMRYNDCLGCLTWVMHNCWLHYRYTMDDAMLREKVFPILRRSINFYRHLLKKGPDGKLHLPPSVSPELGLAGDCNFDLALLRWGCRTLIAACRRLKIDDPLLPEWKKILQLLVDFPADENGFMMGSNRPAPVNHQHMSHLMMIYPLHLVNVEQPDVRKLLEKSVRRYAPSGMPRMGATQSSPAAAALGLGNLAHKRMNEILYRDSPREKLGRNGIYYLATPCIETSLGFNTCVHEMMLQSWGGTIRIFPAMPDQWCHAAFADFRAEGAFLVSAVRTGGRTRFVRIESLAGEPCVIRPALDGKVKVSAKRTPALRKTGEGVYSLDLRKGESAILYDSDRLPELSIEPLPVDPEKRHYFGLK